MNEICAVINFRNHIPLGRALEYFGWCDVFYSENASRKTGSCGFESDILRLNIDFTKYKVLILQQETTTDIFIASLAQKINPNIVIIGNQHGYYKSILEIESCPPACYHRWNLWGRYWIDRMRQILPWKEDKWISLGSLLHDYYFKTKSWQSNRTNGKALVIYEPNANESYGDKFPSINSAKMEILFETLEDLDIPYEIKSHPLWPDLKGNDGREMWKPPKDMRDFDTERIIEYSLILGCRSTVLLDAVSMQMPVVGLATESAWPDDHYGPGEMELFPYCSDKHKLKSTILENFNKKINYSYKKLKYFLGELGRVDQIYLDFCKNISLPRKKNIRIKKKINLNYLNFSKKNATRKAKSKYYFYWARFFRARKYGIENIIKFQIKSFISDPFYCLGSMFTLGIKKIKQK